MPGSLHILVTLFFVFWLSRTTKIIFYVCLLTHFTRQDRHNRNLNNKQNHAMIMLKKLFYEWPIYAFCKLLTSVGIREKKEIPIVDDPDSFLLTSFFFQDETCRKTTVSCFILSVISTTTQKRSFVLFNRLIIVFSRVK